MFSAIGVAGELLAAILDPAYGMAEMAGQPGGTDFFLQQDALVAEAAADIGRDDADARLVEAETAGKTGADDVRQLSGSIDQQLFQSAVPGGDDASALQRRHALPRGAKASAYGDGRRLREAFGGDFDKGFEENVVVPVVVQLRLAGERGTHVNDGGQFLEVDLNSGGEVFGFGTAWRRHRLRLARRRGAPCRMPRRVGRMA